MIEPTVVEPEKSSKNNMFISIRNNFFTGVVVALPIVTTITVIGWFVDLVDNKVKPIIPAQYVPDWVVAIPGLGLLIAVVGLWILGGVASNFFGSKMLKIGERLVNRVPLVRTLYNTMKQIVVAVAGQKDRAFRDVCLLEYPRKGLWAVGFVTADLKGAPAEKLDPGYVCVFVPTTPNPTSGFLLFVKRKDIRILDMTPEEGAKMIISGGMVTSNEELEALTTTPPLS